MSAFVGQAQRIRSIRFTPQGKTRGGQRGPMRVAYGDVVPGLNRREKRANLKTAQRAAIVSKRTSA